MCSSDLTDKSDAVACQQTTQHDVWLLIIDKDQTFEDGVVFASVRAIIRRLSAIFFRGECVLDAATEEVERDEIPALTIYRKREVNIETERKPKTRTTEITADEFYVAVLSNEAKVVLAKFKA